MSLNKHSHEMLLNLNELRGCSNLCDGEIILSDGTVNVQCNVLAAGSPYFRALFKFESNVNCKTESTAESRFKRSYKLEDLSCQVFEKILDFIYTSDLELNDDNIQEMLQAADLLLLENVKSLCCDYLEECLSVSNCIGILQFSERFSCPRVRHLAQTYIDDNFLEVSLGEEFLRLEENQLQPLLQRSCLMISSEDQIYQCLMRWISHDLERRQHRFPDLLYTCVNISQFNESFLQESVLQDPMVKDHRLETWILSKRIPSGDPTTPPQQPRGFCSVIVVAGGEGPSLADPTTIEIKRSVKCVIIRDSSDGSSGQQHKPTSQWVKLADMCVSRVGHGLIEAGGCLYAIGGRDNQGRLMCSGEKYDPLTNTWSAIPLMHHARVGFGLVVIDDKIYAIGGSNDMSDPLTSMEMFDIYTNTWRRLPDMNLKRAWSAYAVCKKKIYVIGGGVMGKLYEAVECFDPRSHTWCSVSPLKERRFDARAIGFGNRIFVFGGLRRLECPSAMHGQFGGGGGVSGMKFCGTEVFLEEQKVWNLKPREPGMCNQRESSRIDAALQCGEEMLLIGDMDMGTEHTHTRQYHCVRAYNPALNMWRCLVANHPPGQRGMSAALLRMPRSMLDSCWAKRGTGVVEGGEGEVAAQNYAQCPT